MSAVLELPLMVVKMDDKWVIHEVSSHIEAFLGFPHSHFHGKPFIDAFGGQPVDGLFELKHHTPSGEAKWLAWNIVSMGAQEKIAMAWDVTSYKQKCDALSTAKQEAEAANKAKTDFIAHTSHELRTPLNAVIGYSEMLLDEIEDADPIEVKHDLEKINSAAKHLLSLINSVLDLSKIEAGRMEIFNEGFELSTMLLEVASTVETLVKKRRNTLELSYPENLGSMTADRTKLRQILFNLLSNACKFTEGGKISVRARTEGSSIALEIEDTGCGMSEEELKKLFIPYSQVGQQRKKPGMGTGLGLMLCKKLTEMMGGSIPVSSILKQGTTFKITLPLVFQQVAPPKKRTSDTVLVIDDNSDVHAILSHFLKKENLKIVSALNGQDGLRLAKECQPLAIILDLVMPGLDGWEVLHKLKEDPKTHDIPVVISTVDDTLGEKARMSIKADEYLIKPINTSLLLTVLNRYRADAKSPYTLLVVDDDPETRTIIVRIAEKEGWKTVEAVNGDAALQELKKIKPTVILLDLMMPVMNGFEFVQEFRKGADYKQIPIVVLTSKDLTLEERNYLGGVAHNIFEKNEKGLEEIKEIIHDIGVGCAHGQHFDRR